MNIMDLFNCGYAFIISLRMVLQPEKHDYKGFDVGNVAYQNKKLLLSMFTS